MNRIWKILKEVSRAEKLKYNNEWRMNDEELWR